MKDILRDCLIEQSKPYALRNIELIQPLHSEIIEGCKILQSLSLGTPIIAQIKAKIDNVEMPQPNQIMSYL